MITQELFNSLFPTKGLNPRKFNLVRERTKLIDALNRILPKYEINNYLRLCAFLGNCGIETDYFRTTSEYATGWDYDISVNPKKARALGNFKKGDGPKYKGGGLSQTTGGYNYEAVQKAIGKLLGVDVVKNPELLRGNIELAVESACIFWKDNNLNYYADRGMFKQLSAIVNRGDLNKTPLHWAKREALYLFCKKLMPTNFSFSKIIQSKPAMTEPIDKPTAEAATAPIVERGTDPVVLTPTEPAKEDDSFLSSAFDRNVSADEVETAAKTTAPRILARFARPFVLLWGALEAGNIYAWLGVVAAIVAVALLIYWHRDDFRKILNSLKTKFTA